MCRKPPQAGTHAQGFSLPLAVFIITVLALIGAAMVSITRTGQESVASEIQSIRTFYAAETGAQFTMSLLFPLAGGVTGCPAVDIASPLEPNHLHLNGCSVVLACEAPPGSDAFVIRSTASCDFAGFTTTRSIAVMAKAP